MWRIYQSAYSIRAQMESDHWSYGLYIAAKDEEHWQSVITSGSEQSD